MRAMRCSSPLLPGCKSGLSIGLGLVAGVLLLTPPSLASQPRSQPTSQPASQCPGFRVIRDRSDHEAPRLPRQSIAARAILSPDGCDRSREAESARMQNPQEGERHLRSVEPGEGR